MNRKLVLIIALTLLVGMLNVALDVQSVESDYAWTETIYIRADGSVGPEGTPISTFDNVTYTFAGNINDSIVIERDNIVVDGAGYTLQGTGAEHYKGIDLSRKKNVAIRNADIRECWYGIWLSISSNNSIHGNNIRSNMYSIYLDNSSNSSILGNNITNNGEGIYLDNSSSYNSISGNNITASNGDGIYLNSSSNNSVCRNNLTNNRNGIYLKWSSENSICGDNMANKNYGVWLTESSNNNIYGNNITNSEYSIGFWNSSDNEFHHNNFVNNTHEVNDYSWDNPWISQSINAWDDGLEGNYWSNHTKVDADSDGIDDTPYVIDGNNTGSYPLMGMFSDFNAPSEHLVQTICNSSISGFKSDGASISFNVTGEDGTAGFCRICIPTALMNATYRVFVNGTEVQCNLLPCSNSSYSYLYFTYSHSTEQIIIVPEFPSFITLSLFMILAMLALTFANRRFRRKPEAEGRRTPTNTRYTRVTVSHIL
jgi:parallel beta-helix repeat protein